MENKQVDDVAEVTDEMLIASASEIISDFRVGGFYIPENNNFCLHCKDFKTGNPSIVIHYSLSAVENPDPLVVITRESIVYPRKNGNNEPLFPRKLIEGLLQSTKDTIAVKLAKRKEGFLKEKNKDV
jgi:hypothetical protein